MLYCSSLESLVAPLPKLGCHQCWKDAMELKALAENHTWERVSLTLEKQMIKNRWVFLKSNRIQPLQGSLSDIGVQVRIWTFAPVAEMKRYKTLIAIAFDLEWLILQMD